MASLEERNGNFRLVLMYRGKRKTFGLGKVSIHDALAHKADAETRLRLIKNNMLEPPSKCSIEDYLLHRGHPPSPSGNPIPPEKRTYELSTMFANYLDSAKVRR